MSAANRNPELFDTDDEPDISNDPDYLAFCDRTNPLYDGLAATELESALNAMQVAMVKLEIALAYGRGENTTSSDDIFGCAR